MDIGDVGDVGARLRSSRESLGLSIESLSRRTRVQSRILAAIEGNDISSIPPKPFGRGFVRAYAAEVGLDPETVVREYFGRFAPDEPAQQAARPPIESGTSGAKWAVAAVVTLLVGGTMLALNRGSAPAAAREEVGTSGSSRGAAVPASEAAPAAALASAPQPAAAPRQIVVTIEVERPCWITATADGERAIYSLLQPGARETLRGLQEIVVRAGDAGAVSLIVNGRNAGRLGGPGEVRTLKITRANADTIGS